MLVMCIDSVLLVVIGISFVSELDSMILLVSSSML